MAQDYGLTAARTACRDAQGLVREASVHKSHLLHLAATVRLVSALLAPRPRSASSKTLYVRHATTGDLHELTRLNAGLFTVCDLMRTSAGPVFLPGTYLGEIRDAVDLLESTCEKLYDRETPEAAAIFADIKAGCHAARASVDSDQSVDPHLAAFIAVDSLATVVSNEVDETFGAVYAAAAGAVDSAEAAAEQAAEAVAESLHVGMQHIRIGARAARVL